MANDKDCKSARPADLLLRRRTVLKGSLGLGMLSLFGRAAFAAMEDAPPAKLGFKSVPVSSADTIVVPAGYKWQAIVPWGAPIVPSGPAFKADASNTADEQLRQFGMHHDGCHFFPIAGSSTHGLWVTNHEYTDEGLLHKDIRFTKDDAGKVNGVANWTAEMTRKSQAAVGVTVAEIALKDSAWTTVASDKARRITALTPCAISGPAAGSALMKTAADPAGTEVIGTFANCAHGVTPWGTYLSCEENFQGQFIKASPDDANHRRYGIATRSSADDASNSYWAITDARFDAGAHPNEPNRFGWVVEIDPFDPGAKPVKRTALGRFRHESATVTLAADNTPVVYMGDDAQNEYIYKFVCGGKYDRHHAAANRDLLDRGTLYVAKLNADGSGAWVELSQGKNGLTADKGFATQADVVVKARLAADIVGATKMDRPEWIAVDPVSRDVYVTLTNNSSRTAADGPNPRAANVYGQILRWKEDRADPKALTMKWDVFLLGGDPDNAKAGTDAQKRRIREQGDIFGSPDGLWVDPRGVLWIDTDISTSVLGRGDYANAGNNMMLACDPATGKVSRFLTGPRGCEITGVIMTPDMKTLFINVQHPGESASELSDPARPKAVSSFPDGAGGGRPRSATIAIMREDGGVIGS